MKLSNWRFAVYLLIISGFWTSFNQILGNTLAWYVRDFVQTKPLLDFTLGFLRSSTPMVPPSVWSATSRLAAR
jgi:hypothetical protein